MAIPCPCGSVSPDGSTNCASCGQPLTPAGASGGFGEVDAGAGGGAGGTIPLATSSAPQQPSADDADAAAEFERMYGKDQPAAAPAPGPVVVEQKKSGSSKLILALLVVFGILAGIAYVVLKQFSGRDVEPAIIVPTDATEVAIPSEKLREKLQEAVAEGNAAIDKEDFIGAKEWLDKAQGYVDRLAVPTPETLRALGERLEFEKGYKEKFASALRTFCSDDARGARTAMLALKELKADDSRPDEYIRHVYFNSGINELQVKQPWEAVWFFEQVLDGGTDDAQSTELLEFARKYQPGDKMGYDYEQKVDSLQPRRPGCR